MERPSIRASIQRTRRGPRRRKQIGTKEQCRVRADFIVDLIISRPSLTYDARIEETRKNFGCGKGAAEQSHALAKDMLAAARKDYVATALDHILAASREDEEAARRRGDLRTANRIRMDCAKLLGIGSPDRVEITKPVMAFDDLTDEELAVAAKLDRRKADP